MADLQMRTINVVELRPLASLEPTAEVTLSAPDEERATENCTHDAIAVPEEAVANRPAESDASASLLMGRDPPFAGATLGTTPVRTSRFRRRLVIPAAAAAAAVLLAIAISNDLGVRSRLDDTRSSLQSTQASLSGTKATLATTVTERDSFKAELATTTASLATITAERDSLNAELGGVRGTLTDAESRIDLQAGQIETLKSCLNGVSDALGYAADEDYISALAALRAVEVSCDRARELY